MFDIFKYISQVHWVILLFLLAFVVSFGGRSATSPASPVVRFILAILIFVIILPNYGSHILKQELFSKNFFYSFFIGLIILLIGCWCIGINGFKFIGFIFRIVPNFIWLIVVSSLILMTFLSYLKVSDIQTGCSEIGYPNVQFNTCIELNIPFDYSDENNENYHCYRIETEICNNNKPNCRKEIIYKNLLSNTYFIAPTHMKKKVKECMTVQLDDFPLLISLFATNPVQVILDKDNFSLFNCTLDKHLFHPGIVRRKIFEKNNSIYIETLGVGIGEWPIINNNLLVQKRIWKKVDKRFIKSL